MIKHLLIFSVMIMMSMSPCFASKPLSLLTINNIEQAVAEISPLLRSHQVSIPGVKEHLTQHIEKLDGRNDQQRQQEIQKYIKIMTQIATSGSPHGLNVIEAVLIKYATMQYAVLLQSASINSEQAEKQIAIHYLSFKQRSPEHLERFIRYYMQTAEMLDQLNPEQNIESMDSKLEEYRYKGMSFYQRWKEKIIRKYTEIKNMIASFL